MINVNAVGRLAREVDLRYTSTGRAVANFTLICQRGIDSNGNKKTTAINCTQWNKPAETLAKFTTKGSLISVRGDLVSSSYQNKQDPSKTEYTLTLECDNYEFLESKEQTENRRKKLIERQASNQQDRQEQPTFNEPPYFNTP